MLVKFTTTAGERLDIPSTYVEELEASGDYTRIHLPSPAGKHKRMTFEVTECLEDVRKKLPRALVR